MTGSRAAIRYAKAILSLAGEQQAAASVDADMKYVVSTLSRHDELRKALQSPVIKTEKKITILKAVFADSHQFTRDLLNVLAENKRIGLLEEVAVKYIALYDRQKGKEKAIVTTAVPLTEALEKKILAKVKELTGNEVTLEKHIDESIIGGFILRVGDLQYNASVASKLNNLKRALATK